MAATDHRTGTFDSGDVTIFYRLFGSPGGTPIIITHGANYYDSADWIEVASALATDREIAVYDTRGFGRSGWSESKDYTHDAQMGDMVGLLDHLGWARAVVMGHSMGGGRAILFSSRFPERTAATIIVDHCPGRGGGAARGGPSVDNPREIFASVEAALETMSRHTDTPPGSAARARLEEFLAPMDGGFAFPRDPDFGNMVPPGIDGWEPTIAPTDMWAEFAAIKAPTVILRGTLSDRYPPENIARVKAELPHIPMVDIVAGHDIAGAAPGATIDAVRSFLAGL